VFSHELLETEVLLFYILSHGRKVLLINLENILLSHVRCSVVMNFLECIEGALEMHVSFIEVVHASPPESVGPPP
jgi:hypothetical protein